MFNYFFQWKEKKSVGAYTYASYLKSAVLSEVQSDSLSTLGLNLFQLVVVTGSFWNGILLSKMTAISLNQYPQYLLLHYIFLISPGFMALSISLVYIIRHERLRYKIKRELEGLWKGGNNHPIVLPCVWFWIENKK